MIRSLTGFGRPLGDRVEVNSVSASDRLECLRAWRTFPSPHFQRTILSEELQTGPVATFLVCKLVRTWNVAYTCQGVVCASYVNMPSVGCAGKHNVNNVFNFSMDNEVRMLLLLTLEIFLHEACFLCAPRDGGPSDDFLD